VNPGSLILRDAELLLRAEGQHATGSERLPWRSLLAWIACAGFLYGAAMGSSGSQAQQSLYSGLKVPLMLAISSALTLPNFFVVNTLLGLRDDFAEACRGLMSMQATMGLALLSMAPLVLFGYACGIDYQFAKVLNGLMFLLASVCGQITLYRHYRVLIERDPRHRVGMFAWLALYTLIAIQMAWVLRPFIGNPDLPVSFFRADAFQGTAYENLFQILIDSLSFD
tara:strand:- start:662 stop:1336 length:675 start_codon:yes stop_codon:yes gene_type:complete